MGGFTRRLEDLTLYKLLKMHTQSECGKNAVLDFLRFPQGSLIVHRFSTKARAFGVARRNNVMESVFSEKREGFWLGQMIAGRVSGNRRFSRGNGRGNFQNAQSATGCPGVAASSPFLLFGAKDKAAGHRRVAGPPSHDGEIRN